MTYNERDNEQIWDDEETEAATTVTNDATTIVDAGPVSLSVDLNQLLDSTVWADGRSQTAADVILGAAANILVDRLEKTLAAEVINTVKPVIEAKVDQIVTDALITPIEETDGWGHKKAPVTLTARIQEAVKNATTWGNRNSRYDSDKSPIQKYVESEVVRVVKADIDGAIKEVRAAADKTVRAAIGDVINESIDRAKVRL